MAKLGKAAEITRFKGLGEISPDEFAFMIGPEMRLDHLLASGEACRMSCNRFLPHPSLTREKGVVVNGWGENAEKVSCEQY